jgi:hypothetical protein
MFIVHSVHLCGIESRQIYATGSCFDGILRPLPSFKDTK